MRKFIISILLAGAAASPALAQDHGRWHRDEAQSDSQQSHEDRGQPREQRQEVREQGRAERFNGGANAERMQQQQQQAVRQLEMRQQIGGQRGGWDRSRYEGGASPATQQVIEQQQQAERTYRAYRRGYAGAPVQVQRTGPDGVAWSRDRRNWSQDRDGDFRQRQAEQQQRYREGSRWASAGWNRDWRSDRRYDWRSYRNNHRSTFRLGIYYDPFGYRYQPFNIGYSMAPVYFGQQYWIDPALYSLPFPPPGTAWVRYWDDAVLVDLYSGQVVDVIHSFFW